MNISLKIAGAAIFALAVPAIAEAAESLEVKIFEANIDGQGQPLGKVVISETSEGLKFDPDLKGLAPGMRGFHIHTNGNCGPGPDDQTGKTIPAGAAGGHFDPRDTGKHRGPVEEGGHLGDLPALKVEDDGSARTAVTAPRLKKISEIKNRALMIHAGGDNYRDQPEPLGGGGGRVACGVIR